MLCLALIVNSVVYVEMISFILPDQKREGDVFMTVGDHNNDKDMGIGEIVIKKPMASQW